MSHNCACYIQCYWPFWQQHSDFSGTGRLVDFTVHILTFQVALGFAFYAYVPPTYKSYEFPEFAKALGWCMGLLPFAPIPAVMVYRMKSVPGTFREVM